MCLVNTTRQDISNSVKAVARFTIDPGLQHWKIMLKIVACVAGTHESGLTSIRGSGDELSAYADSSFANEMAGRKSVL